MHDRVVSKHCVIGVNAHCSSFGDLHVLCERRGGRHGTDSSRVTRGGCRQAAKGRVRLRAAVTPGCSQRGSCCPPLGDAVQRAVKEHGRLAGQAGREGSVFQQEPFPHVESVKLFQSNPQITPQMPERFVETFREGSTCPFWLLDDS